MNVVNRLFREARWGLMGAAARKRLLAERLGLETAKWVFVAGVSNSGTTLLSRLLASHAAISGMDPEGQNITTGLPSPADFDAARVWTEREDVFRLTESDDDAGLERALYDWSHYLGRGEYLLEKSPPHLIRSRWLQRHFRDAYFITVVRHPYAVCDGIRRRAGHAPERAARHWVRAHEIWLEDVPRLSRALTLRYEDLCSAPDEALSRVSDLLGLAEPFEPVGSDRQFVIHNASDSPAGIRDFNTASDERLTAAEKSAIDAIVGDMSRHFGYDRGRATVVPTASAIG